ncbi:MAG: hypothetical protein V4729_12250 [Pseudomonadota bacterium]
MNTLARSPMHSRRSLKVVLAALLSTFMFALPVTASAEKSKSNIYHSWIMRGQVLSADAGKGIICIGKRDKAKVGDVLTVIRQTPVNAGPRASGFRPVEVGQVRVTSITDDHYSEYEVVKGEPQVNDTVELVRK